MRGLGRRFHTFAVFLFYPDLDSATLLAEGVTLGNEPTDCLIEVDRPTEVSQNVV